MKTKIIITMLILTIFMVSGCGIDSGLTNEVEYTCKEICESNNWIYLNEDFRGWGRLACYCKNLDGGIQVINL